MYYIGPTGSSRVQRPMGLSKDWVRSGPKKTTDYIGSAGPGRVPRPMGWVQSKKVTGHVGFKD